MPSQGKPTINDVARIASVSKKTVSRVINKSPLLSDKTREKVEGVIKDIGFVPNMQARALALRRNFIIAAIHDNPNAQFLVNVQQGILEGIADSEFGLMVQPVDRSSPTVEADIRAFLERHRPYGVVLLPPISERDEIADLCREFDCRYVRMGSVQLDAPLHVVSSNDREAVRDAVTYLLDKGHRKIALIEGPKGSRRRRNGGPVLWKHFQRRGWDLDPDLVRPGHYTFESGVDAAEDLLAKRAKFTAIFACNDEMAIGAMIACRRSGLRIPEDISIVGFDDTPLSSHVWPSLTTVHWPIKQMAYYAARKIIAPEGDPVEQEWMLPSTLMERGSVVPLAKIPPVDIHPCIVK